MPKNSYPPRELVKRAIALVSDLHVGSRFSVFPEDFYSKEGNNISAMMNPGQKELLSFWKFYVKKCKYWKVDSVMLLGDIIHSVNRKEFGSQLLTSEIDEQKRAAIKLLKPLCKGNKVHIVSGTRYHEALDTKAHYDIADGLGGQYHGLLANIQLDKSKRIIQIAHGSSGAWRYRSMQLDQQALDLLAAEALGKVPFHIDMLARGHWHQFIHIHVNKQHLLQLPGWAAYTPWSGAMKSYGKFQPDIGACILFIDQEDRMIVHPYTMPSIPHIADYLKKE